MLDLDALEVLDRALSDADGIEAPRPPRRDDTAQRASRCPHLAMEAAG